MVRHTQTIRRLLPTNCLSVFEHFVGLALKGLRYLNYFMFFTVGKNGMGEKCLGKRYSRHIRKAVVGLEK